MKKLVFMIFAFYIAVSFAYAQESKLSTAIQARIAEKPPAEPAMVLTGDIIDNVCADANKEDIANFVKVHPKDCALMPQCAASGYSILSTGLLTKFDRESNAKIEEFLRNPDSKLQVTVAVKVIGDELNLISIKNQE